MKKILCVILAVATLLSIATVASAYNFQTIDFSEFEFEPVPYGSPDEKYVVKYVVPYLYRREKDYNIIETDKPNTSDISDDNTAYFALVNEDLQLINKADAGEGIKIKTEWELGEDAVESVTIQREKTDREVFAYFLAITLKPNSSTNYRDIVGTITLQNTNGDYRFFRNSQGKRQIKINVLFDTRFGLNYEAEEFTYIEDVTRIHKFNKASEPYETEFTFEDWEDATFTVQVNDQDPMLIKVTNDFNETVAGAYDLCNLDFFNGNGATFNHRGELFLPSEYGRYIYERKGTDLTPVPGAVYDEQDEGFYIQTKKLGNYVISDRDIDVYSTAGVIRAAAGFKLGEE